VTRAIDATHDPDRRSWVESANLVGCDFPIQNLPFGIFRRAGGGEPLRGGVAIGDQILDLRAVHASARFDARTQELLSLCCGTSLNAFMGAGPSAASHLRTVLSGALTAGSSATPWLQTALVPQRDAEFGLPASIGDYTDFYASIHHATSIGRQFRPDNPLLPNYQWLPIAYHGRSSSIQVSERDFHRPRGQYKPKGTETPALAPTERLDFELEVGIFIGRGNTQGSPIPIGDAESHVFGLCLLNDWSARDIQAWEYQPLGPFIAKNFATTISPWIVTLDALAPFRVPLVRTSPFTPPLPYLDDSAQKSTGGVAMTLEVSLETARMRAAGIAPQRLALSNLHHCHWTLAQLIAHHTVGGCNLRPGDLLGTGTLSGPTATEAGSLAELTVGGTAPIALPDGESRAFLADGDRVLLRAWCEGAGRRRIGLGTAAATVLPARAVV